MDDFEKMMNDVGTDFDNASADGFGEEVPDGTYVVHIAKCSLGQSKTSKRWQVAWDFQVVWDPKDKFKNRHVFTYDGITKVNEAGKHEPNEGGMRSVKNRFKMMGLGEVKKEQLPAAIQTAPGLVVAITIKSKGEFTNVYFDGLVARNLSDFKAPASLDALKTQLKGTQMAKNAADRSGGATLPAQRTIVSAEKPKLSFTEE